MTWLTPKSDLGGDKMSHPILTGAAGGDGMSWPTLSMVSEEEGTSRPNLTGVPGGIDPTGGHYIVADPH